MPKTARVSIRLEEGVRAAVERLAEEECRPVSSVIRELLEEAIRMRRCPGIVFVGGPTGRRPVVAGTGLEVWEVVATYRACREDFERLQALYHWLTPTQLRSALAYYRLYPEEIEEEIRRQQALTAEKAEERYPHLMPPSVHSPR